MTLQLPKIMKSWYFLQQELRDAVILIVLVLEADQDTPIASNSANSWSSPTGLLYSSSVWLRFRNTLCWLNTICRLMKACSLQHS